MIGLTVRFEARKSDVRGLPADEVRPAGAVGLVRLLGSLCGIQNPTGLTECFT